MRFKLGHPDFPAHDFYVNALTADVEAQLDRLGPAQIVTTALGHPADDGPPYHGWAKQVNVVQWPRGGDVFASCILTLTDAQADLVEASVAAQVAASGSSAARPYLVLSALLAPAEQGRAAEAYTPAGLSAVAVETELIAWKMHPLAPVRLPEADAGDDYGGLWLLPLVCARYFWRLGPVAPLDGLSSGSGSGSSGSAGSDPGGGDYPLVTVNRGDDEPEWMPPLRAYPADAAAPAHYVQIAENGTHPGIGPGSPRGEAADLQAAMEGWRVVCRDVRTDYNATPSTGTPHDAFTGILSDYPDAPAATESYHLDAARLAGVAGNLISGGASDGTTARSLLARKLRILFRTDEAETTYEVTVGPSVADPTATTDIADDAGGPTEAEALHLPRFNLGVECPDTDPTTAERDVLVAAAKRWALLYYLWRRRPAFYKFPGIAPVIPNGYAEVITWAFRADDFSTTYVGLSPAGEPDAEPVGTSSSSATTAEECFLVVLTGKQYDEANPFLLYEGYRVTDVAEGSGSAAGQLTGYEVGELVDLPIYHIQNVDLPVWTDGDDAGSGDGSPGSGSSNPGDVPEEFVVRVCPGAGDWYLIDDQPRVDIVKKRTPVETAVVAGVTYQVGDLMRYDQETQELAAVKTVYVLDVTNL